jgi:hypothetical protein
MPTPPATHLAEAPADDGHAQRRLRLAPPRWQRRPAFVVLGLLLVLVFAALAAQLYLQVGGRASVLAVARPVPAGHRIGGQDLTEVRVSIDPAVHAVPASDRNQVVGRVALVDLLPRSLLNREAVAATPIPGAGKAIVGVALKPGQLPTILKPGDHVVVVVTPPPPAGGGGAGGGAAASGQPPQVLVDDAVVFDLRQAEADQATVVSVVVARGQAADVARWQASGQVSLVMVAAGQ